MTVIDENADADPGAETAMGPPCVEETELIAPTEAAPTMLAWSTAEAPALSTQHSWRLAAGIAAGVVVGVAVLAGRSASQRGRCARRRNPPSRGRRR